ncbi:MAG: monophosphatase, partial [Chloroflexota bacterium]|nr:monophosphatase [Chloroflexota bacterium]
ARASSLPHTPATTAWTSSAEQVVIEGLEREHAAGRDFRLVSEEAGERTYGAGGDIVVVDPIDGSHNAKMGVPYFSLTLAVASGDGYGSVYEAAVRNLATGEHFEAVAGGGAWRDGRQVRLAAAAGDAINILQVEPARLEEHLPEYIDLFGRAEKIRMLGSAALNICLVATGALSLSLAPTLRSVDAAAALLILREAGGVAADFEGAPLDARDLALATRGSVVAAQSEALLATAVDAIRMGRAQPRA